MSAFGSYKMDQNKSGGGGGGSAFGSYKIQESLQSASVSQKGEESKGSAFG